MSSDYKTELNNLLAKEKKVIPTLQTESSIKRIFEILQNTPTEIFAISDCIGNADFQKPIIPGKRSFRETLIHMLNIETLNYTTIYPAFLLEKPEIFPLHAERDIDRLNLYKDFSRSELMSAFATERKKTLNFLKSLNQKDWSKQMIEQNKQRQETIYWRARGHALHDFTHILILKFQLDI